ncbi:MAG: ABC transporter substrate-binding protein [Actinomycetota bacterium]
MKIRALLTTVLALLVLATVTLASSDTAGVIDIGAIYPTNGSQGPGGIDEWRGVQLAAELANFRGGVDGKKIKLVLSEADHAGQAPGAVRALLARHVPAILGSYGSTISLPASQLAQSNGVVFWETGAVGGFMMDASPGDKVFRFPPTGEVLGHNAVSFAEQHLLPLLHRDASSLRFGVTYVDDSYGRSVGRGYLHQIAQDGLKLAGSFPYTIQPVTDMRALVHRMAAAHIDVLFVSAYMQDAVAMRREMVRQHLRLVTAIGSSSSYCMLGFGQTLGADAVGLFASDKPDGDAIDPSRLSADAGETLRWGRDTFRARYGEPMTAAALTGFAGAWSFFRYVLPRAHGMSADAIARAARAADVPTGALPNGSGLAFGPNETYNARATSVIWEWTKPGVRTIVWPQTFANARLVALTPR